MIAEPFQGSSCLWPIRHPRASLRLPWAADARPLRGRESSLKGCRILSPAPACRRQATRRGGRVDPKRCSLKGCRIPSPAPACRRQATRRGESREQRESSLKGCRIPSPAQRAGTSERDGVVLSLERANGVLRPVSRSTGSIVPVLFSFPRASLRLPWAADARPLRGRGSGGQPHGATAEGLPGSIPPFPARLSLPRRLQRATISFSQMTLS